MASNWFLTALTLLAASPVFADESAPVHVLALDPDVDLKSYAGPYLNSKNGVVIDHELPTSAFAPADVRDKLFAQAGISNFIQAYDALARDELFLRAKHLNGIELRKYYSAIPEKKLAHLSSLVSEWAKKNEAKE